MLCGESVINFLCVYAPQPGLSAEEKDRFHEQLLVLVTSVAPSETLVIAGDSNGHVGQHSQGFSCHHGGYGYGTQNQEGMRILDLCHHDGYSYGTWNQEEMRMLDPCAATDLAVTNTFFISGRWATQSDCILVRRTELKLVKNAKVIENEKCIPQHKLLVAVLKIQTSSEKPCFIAAKRKL